MTIIGQPVVTVDELKQRLLPETREQKRRLDAEQRRYDELWKMQYDGRPARDPLFRLEERLVLQQGLEFKAQRSVLAPCGDAITRNSRPNRSGELARPKRAA